MSTSTYQEGLTIVTRIADGEVEALRASLQAIEDDIEANPYIPFRQFETIHFARWVVFDASTDAQGRPTPAQLVFSTNVDEPVAAHLDELYDKGRDGLNHVYRHCVGYPPPGERTREHVVAYLRQHEMGYNTLYVGTRGRTMRQIHREGALRDRLQDFLDEQLQTDPGFREQAPENIRQALQAFVRAQPDLAWALKGSTYQPRWWPRLRDAAFAGGVGLVLVLPFVVGGLTGWGAGGSVFGGYLLVALAAAGILRRKEQQDEQYPAETDFAHVRTLALREDRIVQNQMSSVTNVKPGWFRGALLALVLRVIDLAGRYLYTKGQLGSIPSIHYARWVLIDGGRRLVFFSNFDGSWENYLGDFIDKAATGLTAVWSNTYGFPRTRWLIRAGATDEQRFKAYARNSQVVTNVWYSAYKRLSVQNINNNSHIRRGLFGPQTEDETEAWLQRL